MQRSGRIREFKLTTIALKNRNTIFLLTFVILLFGGISYKTLPKELFPNEDKVYINKIGNAVVLIPYHDPWKSLFDSLDEFSDDFMENREQPQHQSRESIF